MGFPAEYVGVKSAGPIGVVDMNSEVNDAGMVVLALNGPIVGLLGRFWPALLFKCGLRLLGDSSMACRMRQQEQSGAIGELVVCLTVRYVRYVI